MPVLGQGSAGNDVSNTTVNGSYSRVLGQSSTANNVRNAAAIMNCTPFLCTDSLKLTSHSSKLQVMGSPKGGATVSTQIMFNFLGVTGKALAYSRWIHDYRNRVFKHQEDHLGMPCSVCGQEGWTCVFLLRNPLDRVVSSYLHTMKTKIHLAVQRENPDFTDDLTFAGFTVFLKRFAESRSRYRQDVHYLPQCDAGCEALHSVDMVTLLVESLDAGLAWFGRTTNMTGLSRRNMSSGHYIKKSPHIDPAAAHRPYSEQMRLSPPSYDSFLIDPNISRDICCLFRKDIELYRKACSVAWMRECAECMESCARELRRLKRCDEV